MRLSDSRAEARFRSELTAWLDEHEPPADRAADRPRSPGHIPGWARDWQRVLFDAGWLVPRWPPELGGRDASAVEQLIYLEEMSNRRLPRSTNPVGLDVCAPTLADHGTGAQGDEWLRATLVGETSWCVAIDAPAAPPSEDGDAGIRAGGLAVAEIGGSVTISGSVPAPPGAADADRCLCAAPVTSPGTRVDGVAVVAVDLDLPGVRRPGAAGPAAAGPAADGEPEAVLTFEDVVLGDGAVVGVRDEAWAVVRSLRARLRSLRWISGLLAVRRALATLAEVGRARGLADDGLFRDTIASLQVEADAVRALAYRALARQEAGRPNPELGMMPLVTARVEERVYLAGLEALGADGLDLAMDGPAGWPGGSWAAEWAAALAATAAAGGLGAERDRIASRVLGLRVR